MVRKPPCEVLVKYVIPVDGEGEDWLFTVTSYSHFHDMLLILTDHQMHKQGECEAFLVSSPFISEGMTRFIMSLA